MDTNLPVLETDQGDNNSQEKIGGSVPTIPSNSVSEASPITSPNNEVEFPREELSKTLAQDQTQPTPKIEISQLHELQTEPKDLKYKVIKEVNGIPVEACDSLNFETHPDLKVKEQLEKLSSTKNPLLFQIRALKIIGGNVVFKQLFKDGVPTGLSHGTMDLIYRIGLTDPKSVDGLLDNIDLAVGCLERRCQISDIIEKKMNNESISQITSIAGGTCLLPLEAAYQSKKSNIKITNLDFSDRALQKGSRTLQALEQSNGNRGVTLEYKNADLLSEKIPMKSNSEKEIIECTGFWEYLSFEDREKLLNNISERIQNGDDVILTALVNASESDVRILSALKFKQLYPQPVNEFIAQVGNKFTIERAVLTPNGTYSTLVLKKKADL